jgi:LacI family transcriptional regulator
MSHAVTIQDIAKSLGLSRNTVAKVLNGHAMPEKTVKIVMNKAVEMGYKNLNFSAGGSERRYFNRILITSARPIYDVDFYVPVVKEIESEAFHHSYDIVQFVSDDPKVLKRYVNDSNVDGIVVFDATGSEAIQPILALGKPTVFYDFCPRIYSFQGNFSVVLMEGYHSTKNLLIELIHRSNAKCVGFIGDPTHCFGFEERYRALNDAASECNLSAPAPTSLLFKEGYDYGKTSLLAEALHGLPQIPDIIQCANDYIASRVEKALELLRISIPQSVQIVGFDDSFESANADIPITSFRCDKAALGSAIFQAIHKQIVSPQQNRIISSVLSEAVLRKSTLS